MNDIVNIETIPTAIIGNLSRKEIKDKAADMVVGLDSDDIKSYNPESSRKNRILNRVYNRYNKINGRPDPSVEPTSNFYKWKLKHLFKPEVEIPAHLKDHYAYLTDVNPYFNEGATNVLEIGYAGGFTPTTGYPGEMQLRTMLDDVLLANPEYKYTIDLLDMRKPKRV